MSHKEDTREQNKKRKLEQVEKHKTNIARLVDEGERTCTPVIVVNDVNEQESSSVDTEATEDCTKCDETKRHCYGYGLLKWEWQRTNPVLFEYVKDSLELMETFINMGKCVSRGDQRGWLQNLKWKERVDKTIAKRFRDQCKNKD